MQASRGSLLQTHPYVEVPPLCDNAVISTACGFQSLYGRKRDNSRVLLNASAWKWHTVCLFTLNWPEKVT